MVSKEDPPTEMIGTRYCSLKKRTDDIEKQRVLVINTPFGRHPWIFTKKLKDPEFLKYFWLKVEIREFYFAKQ